MAAVSEAARGCINGLHRPQGTADRFHVDSLAQPAVGMDGKHGYVCANVVGGKKPFPARMDASVGGHGALGAHDIQERQIPIVSARCPQMVLSGKIRARILKCFGDPEALLNR